MKRLRILIIIGCTLFMACTLIATEKDLIGTWKVVDYKTNVDLHPEIIAMGTELSLSRKYLFESNGSFAITSSNESDESAGKWILSKDLKILTLSSNDWENDHELEIVSFTQEKLIFIQHWDGFSDDTYSLLKQ